MLVDSADNNRDVHKGAKDFCQRKVPEKKCGKTQHAAPGTAISLQEPGITSALWLI